MTDSNFQPDRVMTWTKTMPAEFVRAPDGSEVRPLLELTRGGMAHCTLPPGGVSLAVRHKTIEELWYVIAGRGQMWRKHGTHEDVVDAVPGTCLSIPTGAHFQFRNTGDEPFEVIMATLPPWPGMDEAARVADHWPARRHDG
jgi:mannose-6-phosphate isomerase-like protein (cupin superfamily)